MTNPEVLHSVDIESELRSSEHRHSIRIDQAGGLVVLRFIAGGRIWEMIIPDEDVRLANVRISLREFSSRRGGEASILVAWDAYSSARDWLRCIPDGYCSKADLAPALNYFTFGFSSLVLAMQLELDS